MSDNRLSPIPEEIIAKMVSLYEIEGLNVEAIKQRFPRWSRGRIADAIRAKTGRTHLGNRRTHGPGWCAS